MPHAELQFHWTWQLAAPPAALWPLISNTDRFNRDCGLPPITVVPPGETEVRRPVTNSRRLRTKVLGMTVEWDELAFEWVAPHRFGVERIYRRGPLARMAVGCQLEPRLAGGTTVAYDVRATPSGWLGRVAAPYALGRRAGRIFESVVRRYDELALSGVRNSSVARKPKLAAGGSERLTVLCRTLAAERSQPVELVERLRDFLVAADDFAVSRIRPYALADDWNSDRRATLQLFLHATRAGALDFSWDLVCPHCRGVKAAAATLAGVSGRGHCDTCRIDFDADFDRSVELTFTPNASVRPTVRADYCVGGPQVTPHVLAQQKLEPASERTLQLQLGPGRYRVRTEKPELQAPLRVDAAGETRITLDLGASGGSERTISPACRLTLVNRTDEPCLAILEHLAWTDQATTAAEVTSLQTFRDLFAQEILRRGERISVGSMTIVFTDLKNSTEMYRTIGDASAFGRVLTHFDVLREAVGARGGCIVKTMGDAIMAVFPRPVSALEAMIQAHRWLMRPDRFPDGGPGVGIEPLALKAGIHVGPCLAINQNERLDYFGTTVNTAARLCGLCNGTDLVLSSAVCTDPEVAALLEKSTELGIHPDHVQLRGLGEGLFEIRRIRP